MQQNKNKKKKRNYREYRKAKALFKQLKAGIKTWEDMKDEDIRLLQKYYPWLFE